MRKAHTMKIYKPPLFSRLCRWFFDINAFPIRCSKPIRGGITLKKIGLTFIALGVVFIVKKGFSLKVEVKRT